MRQSSDQIGKRGSAWKISLFVVLVLGGASINAVLAHVRESTAVWTRSGDSGEAASEPVIFSEQELSGLKLIAHRGYTPVAPENSLPSFRAAGERRFWAIETDVRKTQDGVLICLHDATIDRMFNGRGAVKDMTLAEIRQYRIDSGNGLDNCSRDDLRLPLFREYLQICKDHGALPFIEHKAGNVADIIAEARRYFEDKDIIISSTDFAVLAQARAVSSEIFIHHIFSSEDYIDDLSALGNAGMAFDYSDLRNPATLAIVKDLITRAHAAGVAVCLRGGDDPATVKRMIELGLDYIPTNVTTIENLADL